MKTLVVVFFAALSQIGFSADPKLTRVEQVLQKADKDPAVGAKEIQELMQEKKGLSEHDMSALEAKALELARPEFKNLYRTLLETDAKPNRSCIALAKIKDKEFAPKILALFQPTSNRVVRNAAIICAVAHYNDPEITKNLAGLMQKQACDPMDSNQIKTYITSTECDVSKSMLAPLAQELKGPNRTVAEVANSKSWLWILEGKK